MKPVMQTITGLKGNCLTACIASLFETTIENVANFHKGTPENCPQDDPEGVNIYWNNVHQYLNANHFGMIHLDNSDNVLETIGMIEGYFLVGGKSPRGFMHSVIYTKDGLAHDPHPEGGGVIPESVSLIYPMFNKSQRED